MKAPDGSYEDGFLIPGADTAPERTGKGSSNLERNNPLSLHDEVDIYSFYGHLLGLSNELGNVWFAHWWLVCWVLDRRLESMEGMVRGC